MKIGNKTYAKLSEELTKLFKPEENDEVISFNSDAAIGFSVKRPYPKDDILFKPAVSQNGQDDSVVLVRVSFRPDQIENGKVKIYADVSKASQYLLNEHFGDIGK